MQWKNTKANTLKIITIICNFIVGTKYSTAKMLMKVLLEFIHIQL